MVIIGSAVLTVDAKMDFHILSHTNVNLLVHLDAVSATS